MNLMEIALGFSVDAPEVMKKYVGSRSNRGFNRLILLRKVFFLENIAK
jgi:hypothetical protein